MSSSITRRSDGEGDRLIAAAAHLLPIAGFPILGPLAIYAWKRSESRFVAFHALQALGLHLAVSAVGIAWFVLWVLQMGAFALLGHAGWFAGVALMALLGLFLLTMFVAMVRAAMEAYRGREVRYPLIGTPIERFAARHVPAVGL